MHLQAGLILLSVTAALATAIETVAESRSEKPCSQVYDFKVSMYDKDYVRCAKLRCKDGQEVELSRACDGTRDCNDGSDEVVGGTCFDCKNGQKVYNFFNGVKRSAECNDISDCKNGKDEPGFLSCTWKSITGMFG